MRYIEMNPVRAGMVETPGHYRWSSDCHNAGLREISFIRHHRAYLDLGETTSAYIQTYQALFSGPIDPETMKKINDAWQTGTPLGNDFFREKIEKQLSRKVGQARRGRPVKGL